MSLGYLELLSHPCMCSVSMVKSNKKNITMQNVPFTFFWLQCKLDYQACSSHKAITMRCKWPCPCLPGQESVKVKIEKTGKSQR